MNTVAEKTDNEVLTVSQRWAGLLIVVGMLLLFGLFLFHQITNTGFFTDMFGLLEKLCLYVPIFISLIAPIVRAVSGRRNPARPFDAAANLSLAIGSFWLWLVFPFDFAHLGDVLPSLSRLITRLITNDIGRLLLLLQWITGPITAVLTMLKYFSVRREMISV
jgi:hypothetical protein